jgi:hypothetical protein
LGEIKFLRLYNDSIIYSTFSGKSDVVSFDEIVSAKIVCISTQFSKTPALLLFSKEKQIKIPLILGNSKNNFLLTHFSKNLKTTIQNETSWKFNFQKTL